MPRSSEKKRYICHLYQILRRRLLERVFRTANGDDDSVEDRKDSALTNAIRSAESRRYLFRSNKYRKAPNERFVLDLPVEDDNENMEVDSDEETEVQPWLNDMEFLQKYRMSRQNFDKVLLRIKLHNVFKKLEGRSGRPQTPVSHQLMVFLKMLGTEGSGANGPNQRNTFMIGKGTSVVFCRRVTEAILSLRDEFYN